MAAKFLLVLCAQTLLVQSIFAQRNNVFVPGGGLSNSAFGLGTSGLGLGTSGLGLGTSGLGLGTSGLGLGISGLGLGTSGLGLGTSGLGLGKVSSIGRGLGNVGVTAGGLSKYNIVNSGPLVVTSISPIGPTGLAVASENVIEGTFVVTGQLPYLSAVAFEGALPTAGSGVATCGCGNGRVAISAEGVGHPPIYY